MNTQHTRRGFTLIELLVVVLIIGILAAVAVPQYQLSVDKSRVMKMLPIMRSILNAQDVYYLANGTYTTNMDELDIHVPYDSRDNETDAGAWGKQRIYRGVEGGNLILYSIMRAVVWGKLATIDMYDQTNNFAECYSASTRGEKICKSIGQPVYTRSDGAVVYSIKL